MPIDLELDGFEELDDALQQLERDAVVEMKPVMQQAMVYLHQELPPYPPKPQPLTASKFWTDKQRRWFFAALRRGSIQATYRRRMSGGLGGSISTEVRTVPGGLEGVIGSNMAYAPEVIGKGSQSPLHAGRWWILEDEVGANIPGAIEILEEGIDKILENL